MNSDEIFEQRYEDSDLAGGWRYSATFQLRTPLAYLERHGELSPGPKKPPLMGPAESHLEDGTGFNPYGAWIPEVDYGQMSRDFGFKVAPPRPSMRAAEGGPVQIGSAEERELLSFLKSFRRIVESGKTLDQMLEELEELSTSTPGNEEMWARYSQGNPLWPDSHFISQLGMQLPKGVGGSRAEKLYRAGFRTAEEVQAASDDELLKVEGIGKGALKKIRGANSQLHQRRGRPESATPNRTQPASEFNRAIDSPHSEPAGAPGGGSASAAAFGGEPGLERSPQSD